MSDRFKNIAKGIGTGLSMLGTAMADGPKMQRIAEIEAEVEMLLQERDHLIARLIEPGDLRPSENYDPNARITTTTAVISSDGGRLTHCEGRRTSSRYHDAHPACPYIERIHNAHEFTARD